MPLTAQYPAMVWLRSLRAVHNMVSASCFVCLLMRATDIPIRWTTASHRDAPLQHYMWSLVTYGPRNISGYLMESISVI